MLIKYVIFFVCSMCCAMQKDQLQETVRLTPTLSELAARAADNHATDPVALPLAGPTVVFQDIDAEKLLRLSHCLFQGPLVQPLEYNGNVTLMDRANNVGLSSIRIAFTSDRSPENIFRELVKMENIEPLLARDPANNRMLLTDICFWQMKCKKLNKDQAYTCDRKNYIDEKAQWVAITDGQDIYMHLPLEIISTIPFLQGLLSYERGQGNNHNKIPIGSHEKSSLLILKDLLHLHYAVYNHTELALDSSKDAYFRQVALRLLWEHYSLHASINFSELAELAAFWHLPPILDAIIAFMLCPKPRAYSYQSVENDEALITQFALTLEISDYEKIYRCLSQDRSIDLQLIGRCLLYKIASMNATQLSDEKNRYCTLLDQILPTIVAADNAIDRSMRIQWSGHLALTTIINASIFSARFGYFLINSEEYLKIQLCNGSLSHPRASTHNTRLNEYLRRRMENEYIPFFNHAYHLNFFKENIHTETVDCQTLDTEYEPSIVALAHFIQKMEEFEDFQQTRFVLNQEKAALLTDLCWWIKKRVYKEIEEAVKWRQTIDDQTYKDWIIEFRRDLVDSPKITFKDKSNNTVDIKFDRNIIESITELNENATDNDKGAEQQTDLIIPVFESDIRSLLVFKDLLYLWHFYAKPFKDFYFDGLAHDLLAHAFEMQRFNVVTVFEIAYQLNLEPLVKVITHFICSVRLTELTQNDGTVQRIIEQLFSRCSSETFKTLFNLCTDGHDDHTMFECIFKGLLYNYCYCSQEDEDGENDELIELIAYWLPSIVRTKHTNHEKALIVKLLNHVKLQTVKDLLSAYRYVQCTRSAYVSAKELTEEEGIDFTKKGFLSNNTIYVAGSTMLSIRQGQCCKIIRKSAEFCESIKSAGKCFDEITLSEWDTPVAPLDMWYLSNAIVGIRCNDGTFRIVERASGTCKSIIELPSDLKNTDTDFVAAYSEKMNILFLSVAQDNRGQHFVLIRTDNIFMRYNFIYRQDSEYLPNETNQQIEALPLIYNEHHENDESGYLKAQPAGMATLYIEQLPYSVLLND